MDENGAAVRVPFSEDGSKHLPLDWAGALLTLWCKRQPEVFGAYLAEVVTGTRPKAART